MTAVNRDVDLLNLLRKNGNSGVGLHVIKVITATPEVTVLFEGTQLALDLDLFEVPVRLLPLEEGSRYFALPIVGNGHRWGLIEKIDGKGIEGTFRTADSTTKTVTVKNGMITDIK